MKYLFWPYIREGIQWSPIVLYFFPSFSFSRLNCFAPESCRQTWPDFCENARHDYSKIKIYSVLWFMVSKNLGFGISARPVPGGWVCQQYGKFRSWLYSPAVHISSRTLHSANERDSMLTMTRRITTTLTLGNFMVIVMELNREKDNYTDLTLMIGSYATTDDCDKEKWLMTMRTTL